MNNQGWIKLYRKIKESPLYKDLNSKQRDILINLLLEVNHKPRKWIFKGEEFEVKAGQMITSLESIANMCAKDVTIQNVRTCLLKLEKYGFLTNKSTNKNRLITIVNWELYQNEEEKQQTNQQAVNKQLTTNKNVKNNKNNIYSASSEALWKLYPNKKNKSKAMLKIPKLISEYGYEQIEQCIKRYIDYVEEERRNGFKSLKYQAGSTFFNGTYIDYLDANYQEKPKEQPLYEKPRGKVIEMKIGEG